MESWPGYRIEKEGKGGIFFKTGSGRVARRKKSSRAPPGGLGKVGRLSANSGGEGGGGEKGGPSTNLVREKERVKRKPDHETKKRRTR